MRVSGFIVLFALSILVNSVQANPTGNHLRPFVTDGCSMWIDGPPNNPYLWRHCCVAHDRAYWLGGTRAERTQADEQLLACVTNLGGKAMGDYMHFFVSWGGSPFWLTSYRWGYGWDYMEGGRLRGYKVPAGDELTQVKALLPQAEQRMRDDAATHPVR